MKRQITKTLTTAAMLLLIVFNSHCADEKEDGFFELLFAKVTSDTGKATGTNTPDGPGTNPEPPPPKGEQTFTKTASFYINNQIITPELQTVNPVNPKRVLPNTLANSSNTKKINLKAMTGENIYLVKKDGYDLGLLRFKLDENGKMESLERNLLSQSGFQVVFDDGNKAIDEFYQPLREGEYKSTDYDGNENGFLNDYRGNKTYHDGRDSFRVNSNVYPEVFSSSNGKVVKTYSSCKEGAQTGCNNGLGNLVVVESYSEEKKKNLYFVYWHLSELNPRIKVGVNVSHQDVLGRMGSTGSRISFKYGVHLHFKIQTTLNYEAWGYADKASIEKYYIDPDKIGLISRNGSYRSFYGIETTTLSVKLGAKINLSYNTIGNINSVIISLKRDSEKGDVPNKNFYRHEVDLSNNGKASFDVPNNLNPANDWKLYLRDRETGIFNSSLFNLTVEPIDTGDGTTPPGPCKPGESKTLICEEPISNGMMIKTQNCNTSGIWILTPCAPNCNTGYHLENDICILDAACSPGQVDTQSCGYLLNGTSTKSRTCASNGQWGNFSTCITNCNSGYHPENGVCIQDAACSPGQVDTQSCGYLLNGTSTKSRTCASNGQWGNFSSCITNCNSGYHPENGVCTQDGICTPGQQESQSCSIANGSGSQTRTCGNDRYWGSWSSVCSPTSCYYNYHKENDSCILNEKSCSISNGAGKQYWQGSYWGTCTVIGCNSGYIQSGNSCVQQSALEIISGSTSYGSMTTWPYDSNVFKAVSVINASGNLVVTISKTNGAGLTNPGWYTVYDNTTGNGITSGTYSGGSIISITISRSWLKIGDNRLKIRLNTDPPINAVSVSDTEIKVKRNY